MWISLHCTTFLVSRVNIAAIVQYMCSIYGGWEDYYSFEFQIKTKINYFFSPWYWKEKTTKNEFSAEVSLIEKSQPNNQTKIIQKLKFLHYHNLKNIAAIFFFKCQWNSLQTIFTLSGKKTAEEGLKPQYVELITV